MTIVLILNQSYNGTILVKNNITSTLTSEHIIWICSYCGYISCCHRSSHKQFEDAKGVLRSCNSKKDRQYSDQKKDRQYSDQKKDRQYSDQKTDNTVIKRRTDNTVTKRRTDNTVTKRRTDNTVTKRRTDNTVTKRTKDKKTNNGWENTTLETDDWTTRNTRTLRHGDGLRHFRRVSCRALYISV